MTNQNNYYSIFLQSMDNPDFKLFYVHLRYFINIYYL